MTTKTEGSKRQEAAAEQEPHQVSDHGADHSAAARKSQAERSSDRAVSAIGEDAGLLSQYTQASTGASQTAIALDERAAADFLWRECGVIFAPATLRKWRCIGGGPPFFKAARRVFYEPKPLRDWGMAQRSPNVRSTSEFDEYQQRKKVEPP